jgi:hypothetical protein
MTFKGMNLKFERSKTEEASEGVGPLTTQWQPEIQHPIICHHLSLDKFFVIWPQLEKKK